MNAAKPKYDPSDEHYDYQAVGPLVEACQLGDRDAQRRLHERYGEKIFRLIVRMVETQDAVVQQVFLQVYREMTAKRLPLSRKRIAKKPGPADAVDFVRLRTDGETSSYFIDPP